MSYIRQTSLLEKIAQRRVISPYEAAYLHYLNRQHLAGEVQNLQLGDNSYLQADSRESLVNQLTMDHLSTFHNQQNSRKYSLYQWMVELMFQFDSSTQITTYRGLALLNEQRCVLGEISFKLFRDGEPPKLTIEDFLNFSTYSQYHQKTVTLLDIFKSFALEFKCMIIQIDNTLTLNHYLEGMVPIESFHFLSYLKMWLDLNDDTTDICLNFSHIYFENEGKKFVEDNHSKFTEFIDTKCKEMGINWPNNLPESSLDYVLKYLSSVFSVGDRQGLF